MTTDTGKKRQTKTPQQRAQEALDVAGRKVDRLRAKRDEMKIDLDAVEKELSAALARRDFLAGDPDLPPVQRADTYVSPAGGGQAQTGAGA